MLTGDLKMTIDIEYWIDIDGCGVAGFMKNSTDSVKNSFQTTLAQIIIFCFDAKDKIDTTFAYFGYSFYYASLRVVWLLD